MKAISFWILAEVLLFSCISHATPDQSQLCDHPNLCAYCLQGYKCYVKTVDLKILNNITAKAYWLFLDYIGEEFANITQDHLKRFYRLEHLAIKGNVTAFEDDSLTNLVKLKGFTLEYTKVQELPEDMFFGKNSLTYLAIHENRFEVLPLQAILKINYLKYLDLNNIPLQICDGSLIFKGMESLRHLTNLTFVGINLPPSCKTLIDEKFFRPLWPSILFLNVTASHLQFQSNFKVFKNFYKLQTLDVSDVQEFKKCPSSFVKYFEYLPSTLKSLYLNNWNTGFPLNESCSWNTNETISVLEAQIPRLQLHTFTSEFNDLMYGTTLTKAMMSPFRNLSSLSINFCRINTFEYGVFDNFANLSFLNLDGNPLGPRVFKLATHHDKPIILSLSRVSIPSYIGFVYNFPYMVNGFPNLRELSLYINMLHTMPLLTNPETNKSNIEALDLDRNYLSSFRPAQLYPESLPERIEYYYPKLKHLSARGNRINDLRDLPPNLETLNLNGNYIHRPNAEVLIYTPLRKLRHLYKLSLTGNNLPTPPHDLFYEMKHLEYIDLSENNITEIPIGLFQYNKKLIRVSLEKNRISSIDVTQIGLPQSLKYLLLSDNRISTLTPNTLKEFYSRYPKLQLVYLFGNAFDCSCENKYLQDWLKKFVIGGKNYFHADRLKCVAPKYLQGAPILSYNDNFECITLKIIVDLGIAVGCILVAVLIAVPAYKYRWYIRHLKSVMSSFRNHLKDMRFYSSCQYDAYISYNDEDDEDADWITNTLQPALEENEAYSEVCYT